jgi:hypothetical protein
MREKEREKERERERDEFDLYFLQIPRIFLTGEVSLFYS